MYADDTRHITSAGSDLHLIQSSLSPDLEKLSKWLFSNTLALKATKTEFMLFCLRQRLSILSRIHSNSALIMFRLNKFPLRSHSEYIYIDEYLKWDSHIDKDRFRNCSHKASKVICTSIHVHPTQHIQLTSTISLSLLQSSLW